MFLYYVAEHKINARKKNIKFQVAGHLAEDKKGALLFAKKNIRLVFTATESFWDG